MNKEQEPAMKTLWLDNDCMISKEKMTEGERFPFCYV